MLAASQQQQGGGGGHEHEELQGEVERDTDPVVPGEISSTLPGGETPSPGVTTQAEAPYLHHNERTEYHQEFCYTASSDPRQQQQQQQHRQLEDGHLQNGIQSHSDLHSQTDLQQVDLSSYSLQQTYGQGHGQGQLESTTGYHHHHDGGVINDMTQYTGTEDPLIVQQPPASDESSESGLGSSQNSSQGGLHSSFSGNAIQVS